MYCCRLDEKEEELKLDEAGVPVREGPSGSSVHWLAPEHLALPKGARVRLLCGEGVPQHLEGKEGRVVESPVPPMWAVPLPLRNLSALRDTIGHGLVTVRCSASDEIRVAPGKCLVALA